jgi:hypothetical protein
MSYGPIRNPLTLPQWQRLEQRSSTRTCCPASPHVSWPNTHRERVVLPTADLAEVIDEMTAEVADRARAPLTLECADRGQRALVLGQYLAQLDLITAEEELDLHLQMIEVVKEAGLSTVIFKPHPTSARTTIGPLRRRSEELGLDFVLADVPLLAEIVVSATRPATRRLVLLDGTGDREGALRMRDQRPSAPTELVAALAPYQNSNRIPLTIIDALHSGRYVLPEGPRRAGGGLTCDRRAERATGDIRRGGGWLRVATRDLNPLIDAVTYCMQSTSAVIPAAERD